MKINQYYDVQIEREFECRQCGTHVSVTSHKDKRVVFCSQKCEKKYWRLKSKADALHKKRGREKTLGMRNYSAKEMAIKIWKEKKEAFYYEKKE